ncbi:hypothetical protein VPH35_079049 [Triticum aestivum]
MFSPAIRKPHFHRREKEEATPSPPPPAPAHSPSPGGFALSDRPATGTPAPWTTHYCSRPLPSHLSSISPESPHFTVCLYLVEAPEASDAQEPLCHPHRFRHQSKPTGPAILTRSNQCA